MKVKLCPKCGKQNDVDAWNCADCGATLSMNTIVDMGDIQSQVAVAGKGALASVSPFFQDDLTELIKNNTRSSESIVKGCDICKPSEIPPFRFGYLIITSQQLICVCFDSDMKADLLNIVLPKRPWLKRTLLGDLIEGTSSDAILRRDAFGFRFVNRPSYPLTETEKKN
jgi:hypothetical protein